MLSDISDFMEDRQPLQPPAAPPTKEDIRRYEITSEFGSPVAMGQRALLEVQTPPCTLNNCPHPPGHHVGPLYEPDPGIDESLKAWTVQNIRTDPHAHEVIQLCILCGEGEDDLRQHDCVVWARVTA